MARSSRSFHPIRDITTSNAKLVEDVEPELVVFNVDHTKSYMPVAQQPTAAAVRDEMMKKKLSMTFGADILERMGWGNGTRLPFANKENQELEKLLEIRQRKFLAVQTELIDNEEHIKMLEGNFTRTSQDIVAHHNFLASKKKQIEEERDLLSLAERFYSKVVQDKQTTEKALKGCKDRCDRMQCNQERRLTNLCELRDLIEFDREALKDYHDRLRAYQNQKLEIGRIIEEDSKTVEQIDKMYVELGANRKVLKRELDQQAMNTSKSQEQLDRLSMEFRKMYRHRQEMLQLWCNNIENAKRKDAQMQEVADDYFEMREEMRDLTNETEFRERQYKQMQCSIRSTQFHISDLDKKVAEARRSLKEEKELMIQLKDSIMDLQTDIRATSVEERNLRARSSKLDFEISGIAGKLEKASSVVKKLRNKLKEVSNLRNSSDNYINELERILVDEFKKTEVVLREIELTRKCFWERSNDKKMIANDIAHADMSILRFNCSLASLEAKELSNMEYLARQSGKVYRMDLECSTLENKISHAENESINPQYFLVQSIINEIRSEQKKLKEERKYISQQVNYLDHVISKNGAELAKNKDEKSKLNTELLQINMVSQRTQKLTTETDREFQDLQVENSLEAVNLKRLNDGVMQAMDQIYSLSEQRKTIYCAVNERKAEIENNGALNNSKLKALRDTTDRLKVQIREMESRTDKLRGRFDLITKMMMDTKSNETEEESIAYRVRKAARERESLQLELRKWEKRVEEAKQELVGLENVSKLLRASNIAVKEKLTPISEGSTESEELQVLDHEEKAIHVRKSRALRFRTVLLDKIEELKQQLAVMNQETQATSQLCKMKIAMASKTENELLKQREKVQRWNTLCIKLVKEIKPIVKKEDYDVLQQDLKLKLIQEKLECAMTMLDKLLASFPDYMKLILEYFEKDENLSSLAQRVVKAATGRSSHRHTNRMTSAFEHSIPTTPLRNTMTSNNDDSSGSADVLVRARSMGDDEGTTASDYTKSVSTTDENEGRRSSLRNGSAES